MEKPKNVRSLFVKLAAAAMAAYLLASFVGGQLQLAAKQRELAELQLQLELKAEQNRELLSLMASDDDTAYIERMARERLGYASARERVYIDLTGE